MEKKLNFNILEKAIWFILLTFLSFVFIPNSVKAQGITATVIVPQPFSPYLDELITESPTIILTNNSAQDITIALRVSLSNGVYFVKTKEEHYSDDIFIAAGKSKTLNKVNYNYHSLLSEGMIDHNVSESEINSFMMTRLFPEGNYSYCIYAYEKISYTQYEPISINGMPAKQGLCSYISILYSNPPKIVMPLDNSTQTPNQSIVFNWIQPSPVASLKDIRYDLYIVRLTEESDPEVEMLNTFYNGSNYHIKIPNINKTSHVFIPVNSTFNMEVGKRYAVMVRAWDTKERSYFQNEGKSEVITFRYNYGFSGGDVGGGTNNPSFGGGDMYSGKVSGRLVFRFKDADPSESYANGGNEITQNDMSFNSDQTPIYNAVPYGNRDISLITSYIFTGTFNGDNVQNFYLSSDMLVVQEVNALKQGRKLLDADHVVGTTRTGLGGNFSFNVNSLNQEFGLIDDNFAFLGVNTSLYGKLYKAYRIKVGNQYLCSPDVNILVNPLQQVDVGTLVSFIKSYSLEIDVREDVYVHPTEIFNHNPENNPVIGNVPIRLFRNSFISPVSLVHVKEGEVGSTSATNSGKFSNKKKANAFGKVTFKHLILHDISNIQDNFMIGYVYDEESGDKILINKEIVFNSTKRRGFPYNRSGEGEAGQSGTITNIVWNSDLVVKTYRARIDLKYSHDIMISGKVRNAEYSESKVLRNALVSLDEYYMQSSTNTVRIKDSSINFRQVRTDRHGDFKFTRLMAKHSVLFKKSSDTERAEDQYTQYPIRRVIRASYPGFYSQRRPSRGTLPSMKEGQHLFNQVFSLTPAGKLNGYVEDEFGRAVEADIDVEGFGTETTKTQHVPGWKHSIEEGGTYISNSKQIINMKAPSGRRKVTITPLNTAYEPRDTAFIITENSSDIRFLVKKAQKRIKFRVLVKSDVANFSQNLYNDKGEVGVENKLTITPIPNAKVTLNRTGHSPMIFYADQNGYVTCLFKDSGKDFNFIVEGPANKNYVKQSFLITGVENSTEINDYGVVRLPLGITIKGTVTYGTSQKPLKSAVVYIEKGNGDRIETFTNQSGYYELKGVEISYINKNIRVWASKSGAIPTLLSSYKFHNVVSNPVLNFNLAESEISLDKIWGIDFELKSCVKQSDGSYKLSGYLLKLGSGNSQSTNFTLKKSDQKIPFTNFTVKKKSAALQYMSSSPSNVVPADEFLVSTITELELVLHNSLEAVQKPSQGSFIKLRKGSDNKGEVFGKVAVVKSAYHFSETQLKFTSSGKEAYYLTQSKGSNKTELVTVRANPAPKQEFGVKGMNSNDININSQGFSGKIRNGKSYISDGVLNMDMEYTINALPNMYPSNIKLEPGIVKATKSSVETSNSTDIVKFKIEKWEFEGKGWSFEPTRSAISIASGIIKTGTLDIPVTNVDIKRNRLDIEDFDINGLKVGGILDVKVVSNDYSFGYNPSAGIGSSGSKGPHYEIRIKGNSIQPAVVMDKIYGLSEGESIKFQEMSLLSNGESFINPGSQESFTTFYDVIKVKPVNFEEKDGHVIMNSEIDLDIPNLNTIYGKVKFEKIGAAVIATLMPLEGVNFQGSGGMTFKGRYGNAIEQTLVWGEFEYIGTVSTPSFSLDSKLIRQKNAAQVKIYPENQRINFGPGIGLKDVKGAAHVNVRKYEWDYLNFEGEMDGFEGVEGDKKKEFEVNGETNAKNNPKISVKGVASAFTGIRMKLVSGGFRGNLDFDKEVLGLKAKGTTEFVADRNGWYFISSGSVNAPLFGQVSAGMLLGDYKKRLPKKDIDKLMRSAYDKTFPVSIRNNFNGFYATGSVPLPISLPSAGFDIGIFSAKFGARSGIDLRVWNQFNDNAVEIGMGVMGFIEAYFKLGLDIGLAKLKISAEGAAEAGVWGRVSSAPGSPFNLTGCLSFSVTGAIEGHYLGVEYDLEETFALALLFNLTNNGFSGSIKRSGCSGVGMDNNW